MAPRLRCAPETTGAQVKLGGRRRRAGRRQERLRQAQAESESAEDSFFPDGPFHVTLVIEEPEAHLHPQLQHSLVRYLRREVQRRPELQIIFSTHATDIITSCNPEEIVVVRRGSMDGTFRGSSPLCR